MAEINGGGSSPLREKRYEAPSSQLATQLLPPDFLFHGILASIIPIPHVSVIPAKIRPAPMSPERAKKADEEVYPRITPSSTSDPAAILT